MPFAVLGVAPEVTESTRSWLVVLALTLGGALFFVVAIMANRMLRPRVPRAEKITTYESGVDPVGQGWAQTQVRYYLYAYLYVLFAVDAVYLFPWATVVQTLGWATLAEMAFFLGILALGLLHAARRGALQWTSESTSLRGRR
jgi:NADH-quinone oxidoreductase subunit A